MEVQTLRHLNEVSERLIRTPGKPGDPKSVLHHIAKTAEVAFGSDLCVILAFNPITGKYIGTPTMVGNLQLKNETTQDIFLVREPYTTVAK